MWGGTASAPFTLVVKAGPVITVTPSQGPVGTTRTVAGTGFSDLSTVGLVFDGKTITRCTSGLLATSGAGAFSCTFKLPSGTSAATVTTTDVGGQKATATFKST